MDFVTLCHPRDGAELAFLKGYLEENEIRFHVINDNFGSLYPGNVSALGQSEIQVFKDDMDRAKDLLDQLPNEMC